MKLRKLAWTVPFALSLLALVPMASAHSASAGPAAATNATLPQPVSGAVTNCTSISTCVYAFNTSAGKGWANSTAAPALQMAMQLPGEAKASYHLSYSAYIAKLTGTWTYWTVGNFVGTDVNSGHVVFGTTNTNYTVTCHGHSGRGGGCTYTYKTDNGTIVVHFTNAAITSTAISCSPTSTSPGGSVSCTVTVTNGWNASKFPRGTVKITIGGTGSLSNHGSCGLSNGTCSFTYHAADDSCGYVTLTANFLGNLGFYKSVGSTQLSVIVSGGC